MSDSTTGRGSRPTMMFGGCGITLLLLATGCKSSNAALKNPSISVQADRNGAGALEGLKVKGSGFTPNASAHLTALMAVSGSTASPYVEQDIQADSSGKFTFEQKPLKCPEPADYGHGSWISVTARDTTSGIAASKALTPGAKPDCGS